MLYENIIAKDGYLVDGETGDKVIFYECDPCKNVECDKALCSPLTEDDARGLGGCSKTVNPEFRVDGGKAWYAALKTPAEGEPYWGREYIEEA